MPIVTIYGKAGEDQRLKSRCQERHIEVYGNSKSLSLCSRAAICINNSSGSMTIIMVGSPPNVIAHDPGLDP